MIARRTCEAPLTGTLDEHVPLGGCAPSVPVPASHDRVGLATAAVDDVLAQRLARCVATRALLQRDPTLNGGTQKLSSLKDVETHAKEVHTTFLDYCYDRVINEQTALGYANDTADGFLGDTSGDIDSATLLKGLIARFEADWVPLLSEKEKRPVGTKRGESAAAAAVAPLPFGTGKYEGKPPNVFSEPVARKAAWGIMWVLAPGVGLEAREPDSKAYALFLRDTLRTIAETQVGAALLALFDPQSSASYRTLTASAYDGITVLIGPPLADQLIKTKEVYAFDGGEGTRVASAAQTTLPRIAFFDRPPPGRSLPVGASGASITCEGLVGHRDFDSAQPFDVVLFHEFMHAFLSQTHLTDGLRDDQEEQIVVGLRSAKGLAFCENAYRRERKLPLRRTYTESGLMKESSFDESWWDKHPIGLAQALDNVKSNKTL